MGTSLIGKVRVMASEMKTELHLDSLTVSGFRGIANLAIPRLGRVTLLAGMNGVGKTSVLDAVQIYAARGRPHVLSGVLSARDETTTAIDVNGDEVLARDWDALFTGRRLYADEIISIGPNRDADTLKIRMVPLAEEAIEQSALFPSNPLAEENALGLEIKFHDSRRTIPIRFLEEMGWGMRRRTQRLLDGQEVLREVSCNTLGPNVPNNTAIDRYWNGVALTPHEEKAVEALNLVTSTTVERVASVGSNTESRTRDRRSFLVKIKGENTPVPLRSLGDGATRSFTVALALAGSSGGFLLIDEVENGIHYSVQPKFWKMILQTAQRNNVQVLATTHSGECAYHFGQVAYELEDVEGILYRIQRTGERLRAVAYPESELVIAAEHGIEVR